MIYWLSRLAVLYIFLLCTGAYCQASSSGFAGYLFSAFQSADNLTISAAAVSPSGNTTTYTDVVFPSVQLPSQTCGDRNDRCDVSVFTIDGSTRVAVLVAVGNGTVVALFDRLNSGLIFIDQHFFFLPGITCSLTTFVQDDIFLYGLCYEFTSNDGVVLLNVYRMVLNFDQLELSSFDLYIAPRSNNFDFYISRGFLSSCTGFTNVYWFGNAFLYDLRVDISDSSVNDQDIGIEQCFDNGTHQVVIFEDSSLLAYCNNNITVEVDFCQRSEPVVTRTRFYCSGSRDTYLEVSDNLTVNSSVDYAIPFPLDLSVPYVGDCVEIRGLLFFVGSSINGFTVLTNVLGNLTTILATDAQVNHQVVDNRFILYSNSTSSALLDLSCPDPSTPIHVNNVSFELSAFFPNSEFSCFTVQPTQPPTIAAIVPMVTTADSTTVEPPTNATSTPEPTTTPFTSGPEYTNTDSQPTMTIPNDTNTSTTRLPPTGISTGLTTGAVVWIVVGSFILLILLLVCVGVCLGLIINRKRKTMHNSIERHSLEMSSIEILPVHSCRFDSLTPYRIEESEVNTYDDTSEVKTYDAKRDTCSKYGPSHHKEELPIVLLPSPHNQSVITSDHQGSLAQSQLPKVLTNPPPSPDSPPPPNVPPPVFASRSPPHTSVDISIPASPPDSDTTTQSDSANQESQEDASCRNTEAVQPADKSTPSEVPAIPSEKPQTQYTNVNLTSPSPPTEPAEHLMDAVAVQDREENKATILTSDTPLPTKNWSKEVRNVETERSVQEIPCSADPHHHASRSSPTVSEESDGADTVVPVQASEETPNNGPEINRSTVTGRANLIPSNNIHSDEHAATLQTRDRKVDEYKAEKMKSATSNQHTPPPQIEERPERTTTEEHNTTEELTTIDDSAEPPSSELNNDDAIQHLSGEVECRPEMPKLDCVVEIDQPKEEDEHDDNNYSRSSDEDL